MITKIPDFRALAIARFLFSFSMQAQAVIVGWWVYDLTHDPLYLGLIGLAEAVPALGFALYSGHLVDRGRPYVFYRNTIVFCLLNALFLLVLSRATSTPRILPCLFLSIFCTGIARSFSGPSLFSLIPQIVPRETLMASSAWLSCMFQLACVAGPALGGLVYSFLGSTAAIVFVVFCGAGSLISLIRITPTTRSIQNHGVKSESIYMSIRAGVEFVFKQKIVLSTMSLDMFSVLLGGATALLPAFSDKILHAGPMGLGILRSAPAVGAVAMSAYLILKPLKKTSGKLLLSVIAGFGLSIVGFGISKSIPISIIFLIASGALDSVSMVIRNTILQFTTPNVMRGRVSAVNSMFVGSSNEIGAFESGLSARVMGLVPSVIFGGVMTLFVVGAALLISPELRKMEIET